MGNIKKILFSMIMSCCFILAIAGSVKAETKCKNIKAVEKVLAEELSVDDSSEFVFCTGFKAAADDIYDAFDKASIANGKILCGTLSLYSSYFMGKYTYKITVSPADFCPVVVCNSEKKLYVSALEALAKADYDTYFYTGESSCYDMIYLVLEQHPEFNYRVEATKCTTLSKKVVCGYRPSSSYSASKIKKMMKKVDEKTDEILDSIIKPSMTQKEKASAIHAYIAKNCKYAAISSKANVYTAYGCLIDKSAVCQGYTAALNLMLEKCGITSIAVCGYGNGEEHAWTYSKAGENYFYTDVTWDDPVPDRGSDYLTTYFWISETQMGQNHSWVKTDYSAKYLKYTKKGYAHIL